MPIPKGFKHSEETKLKMRKRRLGFKVSSATKEKISLANKGSFRSPEVRKKISETNKRKGLRPPPGTGVKKGAKFSEEHKKRISLSKKGNKSHFWKGGISPISKNIRERIEYKLWRKIVFERDNYTCVWCGDKRGGHLNADHIIPLSKIIEKVKFNKGIENLLENCLKDTLFSDPSNGRTLCIDCHKKTDTYGKNFTKRVFNS